MCLGMSLSLSLGRHHEGDDGVADEDRVKYGYVFGGEGSESIDVVGCVDFDVDVEKVGWSVSLVVCVRWSASGWSWYEELFEELFDERLDWCDISELSFGMVSRSFLLCLSLW